MANVGRFYFAKFLELMGLSVVTLAFIRGVSPDGSEKEELLLLGVGSTIFLAGYLIRRASGEK